MQQKEYIGIDFGTTNTAVVRLIEDEYGMTRPYLLGEGELPFPSLVAIHKKTGEVLFGRQVKIKRIQLSNEYYIVSSVKSLLASDDENLQIKTECGKVFTPTDIVACLLKGIKEYILNQNGVDITEATFAVPVGFTSKQRAELKKAAQAAEIVVKGLISESTAAYVRNGHSVKGLSKVLVFDWGGGTLDISILDINKKNMLYELAVYGEPIGGDMIDRMLAQKIHSDIVKKSGLEYSFEDMGSEEKDQLISRCENAKIALSTSDYRSISLLNYGIFGTQRIPMEKGTFSEVIQPVIYKAIKTINKTLDKADLSPANIDSFIMVGGSCGLSPLQEAVTKIFEEKGTKVIYPQKMQWSVAEGAAMIAASDSAYKLNQDVGVILSDDSFFPILEKDNSIPHKINPIYFGVIEETTDAHFIVSDEHKRIYTIENINTKGFLREELEVNAEIDQDLIARLTIKSRYLGKNHTKTIEIKDLNLYYDVTRIENFITSDLEMEE